MQQLIFKLIYFLVSDINFRAKFNLFAPLTISYTRQKLPELNASVRAFSHATH